ncbi:MAG TPA: CvpA family protein [Spongiibacteraceae bacterium]|nr:CvpA family protein [Spongiibacteraceae bacterium]
MTSLHMIDWSWVNWNWADWTIVAILGVSCVLSLLRGFVREALSMVAWILATFVAIAFHERLAAVFSKWIDTPSLRLIMAFATLFVLTLLVGAIVNKLLGTLIAASGLGGLDRLLGTVFGLTRGLLIVLAIVIWLPMALPVKQDSWWYESALIPHFESSEGLAREAFGEVMGLSKALAHKVPAAKAS